MRFLLQKYADEKDYIQLNELLAAENTTYALRTLVSSKTEQGIFADAQILLDAMPADTPEEQDYKTVQQININRLGNAGFELSESQYQQLKTIADIRGYQAPAACAMLSLLRGEYCEWQLPNNSGSGKTSPHPRHKTAPLLDKAAISGFKISPNPANNSITIQLPVYLSEQPVLLYIYDLQGRLYKTIPVESKQTIFIVSTSDFPNGLFLFSLRADGIILANAKVLIQR